MKPDKLRIVLVAKWQSRSLLKNDCCQKLTMERNLDVLYNIVKGLVTNVSAVAADSAAWGSDQQGGSVWRPVRRQAVATVSVAGFSDRCGGNSKRSRQWQHIATDIAAERWRPIRRQEELNKSIKHNSSLFFL